MSQLLWPTTPPHPVCPAPASWTWASEVSRGHVIHLEVSGLWSSWSCIRIQRSLLCQCSRSGSMSCATAEGLKALLPVFYFGQYFLFSQFKSEVFLSLKHTPKRSTKRSFWHWVVRDDIRGNWWFWQDEQADNWKYTSSQMSVTTVQKAALR